MAIDTEQIREKIFSPYWRGDPTTGLIRRFGMNFNSAPVSFLVGREVEFIHTLGPSSRSLSEKVLIDAAQWDAYSIYSAVMASLEWADLIGPDRNSPIKQLEGLVALTNCFGWGRIVNPILDVTAQEIRFSVVDSYYVEYWRRKFGLAEQPVCILWTGVAGGLLDTILGNRIHEFEGEELDCAAKSGDPVCMFKASKAKRKFSKV
jgi:predicted hydrocarbon binding protein